jgi:uncharacterized surface protein with fasciclin (FAS1) repeats
VTTSRLNRLLAAAALAGLLAGTSACGSDGSGSAGTAATGAASSTGAGAATAGSSAAGTSSRGTAAAAPTAPFGPGCAALPAQGPGSLASTATLPVATAVSQVPPTTVLTQAVLAANLVDVLNSRPDITVLAPVDAAFRAVDPGQLNGLLADVPRLTTVLTHHVLPGRLTPSQLVGRHTTLDGDTVTVSGSGTDLTVSADQTLVGAAPATVLCGSVPTANATVYLIDQVLGPIAAG